MTLDQRVLRAQANLGAVDILIDRFHKLADAGHTQGALTLQAAATRLRDEAVALMQEMSL